MSRIIKIEDNCEEAVLTAKKIFYEGKVFIYPTDTIYGFGANPFNRDAVDKITAIKKRDESKNYIFLIASIEQLLNYTEIEKERELDFLNEIWPNPVSIILKLNSKTSAILQQETAAFRIPNNRFCYKLLSAIKMPLVSTSVNKSGEPPFMDPSQIIDKYAEEVDAVFYSIKPVNSISSTLIDITSGRPVIIREGKYLFKDTINKYF